MCSCLVLALLLITSTSTTVPSQVLATALVLALVLVPVLVQVLVPEYLVPCSSVCATTTTTSTTTCFRADARCRPFIRTIIVETCRDGACALHASSGVPDPTGHCVRNLTARRSLAADLLENYLALCAAVHRPCAQRLLDEAVDTIWHDLCGHTFAVMALYYLLLPNSPCSWDVCVAKVEAVCGRKP